MTHREHRLSSVLFQQSPNETVNAREDVVGLFVRWSRVVDGPVELFHVFVALAIVGRVDFVHLVDDDQLFGFFVVEHRSYNVRCFLSSLLWTAVELVNQAELLFENLSRGEDLSDAQLGESVAWKSSVVDAQWVVYQPMTNEDEPRHLTITIAALLHSIHAITAVVVVVVVDHPDLSFAYGEVAVN